MQLSRGRTRRARPGRGSNKADTRRQLLDAAAELVAEKGWAGASLMEIAERADLTTGAVYSNFRSKEDLMLAVVSHQLDLMGGEAPGSVAELLDEVREAAQVTADAEVQAVLRAQVEIVLLGLRDRAVQAELQRREAALVEKLAEVLEDAGSAQWDPPPPTMSQLAEVFYASLQGMQQHRLMFPEALPVEVFDWWAKTMLNAAAAISRDRAGGGDKGTAP